MTIYYKSILMSLGLLLCLSSSAQTLSYQQGSISLNNGKTLTGYLTIINSQKVHFKTNLNEKRKQRFKSEEIAYFSYDKKRFQTISHDKSTFFVREIMKGKISLFKRDFAPNKQKAYFIKSVNSFKIITKDNFYAQLKDNMIDFSVFENYSEDLFLLAYNYNQTDLSNLVYDYNLETPKTMMAYDLHEPIDTLGEEILGFAVSTPSGMDTQGRELTRIPNTARNDMVLKSEVIYAQILDALKAGNWKKINIALKYLQPLAHEIETNNTTKMYSKMVLYAKQQEKTKFRNAFVEFVSTGVHTLINSANLQKNATMRKLVIRQAFVEYLEIKPELQKIDAALGNKITAQFKSAFANASNSTKFKTETAKISASFRSVASKV